MNKYYAMIPVVTFAGLIASGYAILPNEELGVFDPISYAVLNTVLIGGIFVLVAYVSALCYLKDGSVSLIYVGSSVLALGLAHTVGPWLGPEMGIPVSNVGYLFSSITSLTSAILIVTEGNTPISTSSRGPIVAVPYLVVLVFFAALVTASFQGVFPVFYVEELGSTSIRAGVMRIAVLAYFLSVLLLGVWYLRSKSDFLFWYSLALALVAVGLGAFTVSRNIGGPTEWLGRVSLYVSGPYFINAILRTVKNPAHHQRKELTARSNEARSALRKEPMSV
jgi:hypothetical protein